MGSCRMVAVVAFLVAEIAHIDLEGVDFRSSFNYSIDPSLNRIKKARFAISGLPGLLDKFDIEIEE